MDLVEKFTNLGELFVEWFVGNLYIAKYFMFFPKHSRFVGCDKYEAWIEGSDDKILVYM